VPSPFPGALDNIAADKTDNTIAEGDHPAHHNQLAEAINATQAYLLEIAVAGGAGRAFEAGREYQAGDVATYDGKIYAAIAAFTAGGAFDPANWQQVGGGPPQIVQAGNLGAFYDLDVAGDAEIWLAGTLNANCTIQITGAVAGSRVVLLVTQDAVGSRALEISDGTEAAAVDIDTDPLAVTRLVVETPAATDLIVTSPIAVSGGSLSGGSAGYIGPPSTKTASYTLAVGDKNIEMDSASSRFIYVPTLADASIPIGTQIVLTRIGAGAVSVIANSGVTILSAGSLTGLVRYKPATLTKRADDAWVLSAAELVAGEVPFSPLDLNPLVWLAADEIAGLSDGATIVTVPNLGSLGDAVVPGTLRAPTYEIENGIPTIYFDGSPNSGTGQLRQQLRITDAAFSAAFPLHVIGVLDLRGDTTSRTAWDGATVNSMRMRDKTTSNTLFEPSMGTAGADSGADIALGTFCIVSHHVRGGGVATAHLRVNGGAPVTGVNGNPANPGGAVKLGTDGSDTAAWFGGVRDWLIFSGQLSDTNEVNVMRYLGEKHGITAP
jgi:hypothetical protein